MHYDRYTLTDTPRDVVDGLVLVDAGGESLPAIAGYLQRVPTGAPGGSRQIVVSRSGPIDLDAVLLDADLDAARRT